MLISAIVTTTAIFVMLAFPIERSRNYKFKVAFYAACVLAAASLVTIGAQTGMLFDGRARSDDWLGEMFLPTLAFLSWVAFIMYFVAERFYRAFPSYLVFFAMFVLVFVLSVVLSATVVVSALGS